MRYFRIVGIGALVLAVLQCGLWVTIGRPTLPRIIPAIIERNVAESLRIIEQSGTQVEPSGGMTYRICDDLYRVVGDSGVSRISDAVGSIGHTVVVTDPPDTPGDDSFRRLCYWVDLNTPLFAEITYGSTAHWGTKNRTWFVLGFWIQGRPLESWVA